MEYKQMTKEETRQFIKTATQAEIIEYWKQVMAPKYGFTELQDPITGEVIARA